jgi:hypothetical protein
MGDSGSLFLGFMLAAGSLELQAYADSTVALIIPVVLLGVPIIDTVVTILRRLLNGASIFYPDHDHVHHRLREAFSHEQAVLILYGVALWFGTAAFLMALLPPSWAYVVLGVVVVTTAMGLHLVGYLEARAIFRAARFQYVTSQRRRLHASHGRDGEATESAMTDAEVTTGEVTNGEASKPVSHGADNTSSNGVSPSDADSPASPDDQGDGVIDDRPPRIAPSESSETAPSG